MEQKLFKVNLEIDLFADNELDAAKKLEEIIKEESNFQYYVENQETNEKFSVDLAECDEEAVLKIS